MGFVYRSAFLGGYYVAAVVVVSKCVCGGGGCLCYSYLQLRAKLNCEWHSSTWSSGRLSRGASGSHLMTHVWSWSTATMAGRVSLGLIPAWGLIPTNPVNIPCWRKPECRKTHDVRQSVEWLFSHGYHNVHNGNRTLSEVKGACSDDCATEAPSRLRHRSPLSLSLLYVIVFS
jgi:hypothetical protein